MTLLTGLVDLLIGLEEARSEINKSENIGVIKKIKSSKFKNKECMEFLFSLNLRSNIQLTLLRSNK